MKPRFVIRLSITLLILASGLIACVDYSSNPIRIAATIEIPENPDLPESGQFIPANTPLLFTISITNPSASPFDGFINVRVIDHNEIEYHRRSWRINGLLSGTNEIKRLFRITNLPGSRKINIQMGISDTSDKLIRTGMEHPGIWHDVAEGYALHGTVAWARGWYAPETSEQLSRGCNGTGIIHMPRPPFRSVLRIKGVAPVHCFEDHFWTLSMVMNTHPLIQTTVLKNEFDHAVTIVPDVFTPECDAGNRSWPVGEMELEIRSDKVFDPKTCQNIDDNRVLAFHLTYLEQGDFLPDKGFYGPRESDGRYWPAPDSIILLPSPEKETHLYIQGRRDTVCMEMPQSLTLTADGQHLGSFVIDSDSFFLSVPYTPKDNAGNAPIALGMTVSPIFFRTQCTEETDDPRPYGIGIDEVCFR